MNPYDSHGFSSSSLLQGDSPRSMDLPVTLVALRHQAASRACRSVRTRSKVTFFALSGAQRSVRSGVLNHQPTRTQPVENRHLGIPFSPKNCQFLRWFSPFFFWLIVVYFGGLARFDCLRKSMFFGCCWLLVLLVLKQRIWAQLWCKSIEASTLLKSPWRSKSFERRKLWYPLVYHDLVNSPSSAVVAVLAVHPVSNSNQKNASNASFQVWNQKPWNFFCALEFGWQMRLAMQLMLEKQTAS